MTLLTMNNSDYGFSQQYFSVLDKLFYTKSAEKEIIISKDQNTTMNSHYAFNPILNEIVQIDPNQSWFWKPEWLNDEIIIENELKNGDYEDFDSIDDFIENL